MRMLLFVKMII